MKLLITSGFAVAVVVVVTLGVFMLASLMPAPTIELNLNVLVGYEVDAWICRMVACGSCGFIIVDSRFSCWNEEEEEEADANAILVVSCGSDSLVNIWLIFILLQILGSALNFILGLFELDFQIFKKTSFLNLKVIFVFLYFISLNSLVFRTRISRIYIDFFHSTASEYM
jgi:hypothetical protein